ncbi:MAG: hemerythrin domain-containing protein [Pirellulaceae bacterium]|nr:hemerythrin domain-containing protein [Pirellulaceae bacterium]
MVDKSSTRITVNAPFFQEIKQDHLQLQKLLVELEKLTGNRIALQNHPRQFLELIEALVDQLALHFSLEEAYGYFDHALEESPRFHEQAVKLRDQHAPLYNTIREIAESVVKQCSGKHPQLDSAADRFADFNRSLKAHESAEMSMILESLNRDMGGGD